MTTDLTSQFSMCSFTDQNFATVRAILQFFWGADPSLFGIFGFNIGVEANNAQMTGQTDYVYLYQ